MDARMQEKSRNVTSREKKSRRYSDNKTLSKRSCRPQIDKYGDKQCKSESMFFKTDMHGPKGPTAASNKAVKSDFEMNMIKDVEGCYQVITSNRYRIQKYAELSHRSHENRQTLVLKELQSTRKIIFMTKCCHSSSKKNPWRMMAPIVDLLQ